MCRTLVVVLLSCIFGCGVIPTPLYAQGNPAWGGFGRSGFGRGFSDEDLLRRFRDYDKNADGRLTVEEVSVRMKPYFATADKNRDGVLDFAEYKQYVSDRMASFGMGMAGGSPGFGSMSGMTPSPSPSPVNSATTSTPPGPPGPSFYDYGFRPYPPPPPNGRSYYDLYRRDDPKEKDKDKSKERDKPNPSPSSDSKAVAIRYGKMPKGLPDWFVTLDTDKDGQIGLYEWRRGNRLTAEFLALDLNDDGLLTAEEYLRGEQLAAENKKREELLSTLGASPVVSPPANARTTVTDTPARSEPPRSTPPRNPFITSGSEGPSPPGSSTPSSSGRDESKRRFFSGFGRGMTRPSNDAGKSSSR